LKIEDKKAVEVEEVKEGKEKKNICVNLKKNVKRTAVKSNSFILERNTKLLNVKPYCSLNLLNLINT